MLAGTMCIECRTVRPFFNENKMPRILFISIQIISNTQRLSFRCRDELTVQREDDVDALGFDKIFGNDL